MDITASMLRKSTIIFASLIVTIVPCFLRIVCAFFGVIIVDFDCEVKNMFVLSDTNTFIHECKQLDPIILELKKLPC